jgi:hypothetical protein
VILALPMLDSRKLQLHILPQLEVFQVSIVVEMVVNDLDASTTEDASGAERWVPVWAAVIAAFVLLL